MASATQPRLLRLRYEGTCVICRTVVPRGAEAWWYPNKKEVVCVSCQTADPHVVGEVKEHGAEVEEIESLPLTALGQAGASARRESVRRSERREREMLKKHPRVGKLILRV